MKKIAFMFLATLSLDKIKTASKFNSEVFDNQDKACSPRIKKVGENRGQNTLQEYKQLADEYEASIERHCLSKLPQIAYLAAAAGCGALAYDTTISQEYLAIKIPAICALVAGIFASQSLHAKTLMYKAKNLAICKQLIGREESGK